MRPRFEIMAKMAIGSVTNLMGEPAIWLSSSQGEIAGDILFKNPTEAEPVGDSESYEYRISNTTAEYYTETFPGLKEAVDSEETEYMIIRGQQYLVIGVTTKFDGKIYVAQLEPHEQYD